MTSWTRGRLAGRLWIWLLFLAPLVIAVNGRAETGEKRSRTSAYRWVPWGPAVANQQHLGVIERDDHDNDDGEEQGGDGSGWAGGQVTVDGDLAINPLEELHHALETLQSHYFELWVGTWPDTIEWTGAVTGTYLSASLNSLTRSLDYMFPAQPAEEGPRVENEINRYFSQSLAYYFGENIFSIMNQAHDDMLWVVLGWLESIKFIALHAKKHYPAADSPLHREDWYGGQFVPAFAHRARVFYELAAKGWDTKLCGGGMLWNPRLLPYKNAITNQLYISASIGMYLYFTGDKNSSPFMIQGHRQDPWPGDQSEVAHDRKYLLAAVDAYTWLKSSNMTNDKGLYVDGFHIKNYGRNSSTNQCDERNEMVYTYNQGVLLSGLRGLWEGTGTVSYLTDGHKLIRNVIAATGWAVTEQAVSPTSTNTSTWSGLGRNGILEELCDHAGTCNQDGQTFKGIYFHHLTLFCEPLPEEPLLPGKTYTADRELRTLHAQSCKTYSPWVARNARAALATRDSNGDFGMWWGGPVQEDDARLPVGAKDWRNNDTLLQDLGLPKRVQLVGRQGGDANDRGRGRTVETQGGGVSVVRALWEFLNMYYE